MPVLPTVAQTIYFYGAIAAFAVFGVTVAYGLIATTTLPASKPKAAPSPEGLAHAH